MILLKKYFFLLASVCISITFFQLLIQPLLYSFGADFYYQFNQLYYLVVILSSLFIQATYHLSNGDNIKGFYLYTSFGLILYALIILIVAPDQILFGLAFFLADFLFYILRYKNKDELTLGVTFLQSFIVYILIINEFKPESAYAYAYFLVFLAFFVFLTFIVKGVKDFPVKKLKPEHAVYVLVTSSFRFLDKYIDKLVCLYFVYEPKYLLPAITLSGLISFFVNIGSKLLFSQRKYVITKLNGKVIKGKYIILGVITVCIILILSTYIVSLGLIKLYNIELTKELILLLFLIVIARVLQSISSCIYTVWFDNLKKDLSIVYRTLILFILFAFIHYYYHLSIDLFVYIISFYYLFSCMCDYYRINHKTFNI